jgi:tRNA dimethylallyltransferase
MKGAFFIVGPTATGKSEIAAEVAKACGGEIVSADAFQIYSGLNLLTAKPEPKLLRVVPHHLIGVVDPIEEMNAQQFREAALAAIEGVRARGKPVFVVGGSGMYVKALTHGLSPLPPKSEALRAGLNQLSENELFIRLRDLDPETSRTIDARNKPRLIRALEIYLLTGCPASEQRTLTAPTVEPFGVFVFRARTELYRRINERIEKMFEQGVVDEVRTAPDFGPTAAKTIGLAAIRDLIAGRISQAACIAAIQRATRQYAKRQLTWFQHQTNFEPLNLSLLGSSKAIELISQKARLSFAHQNV